MTDAMTSPFLGSVSTMIRFFDICSWTRMTCESSHRQSAKCFQRKEQRVGEPHLFRSLNDKVASWVERALGHVCQLRMRLVFEDTLVTSKHNGQSTDGLSSTLDDLLASRVLDVDEDLGGVRRVSQATLVRRDLSVDGFGVRAFWLTDPDVRVLQPEARIDV